MSATPMIDSPCHRTTLALPWLLNGSLDQAEYQVERRAVREHLIHCPSCRAELARTRETLAAFTAARATQHQALPFQAPRAAANRPVVRRLAWAAVVTAALSSLTGAWWLVRSEATTAARQQRTAAAGIAAMPARVAAAPAPAAQIAAPSPIATITTPATPPAPPRIAARPARPRTPAASAPTQIAETSRDAEATPWVIAAIDFENGAASPADRSARISEADFEGGDLAWKQKGFK